MFSYSVVCDEDLYDLRYLKFTLQPLVENAVYHGIKKLEGPGEVRVRVAIEQGLLWMHVQNTSPPIPQETLDRLRHKLKEETPMEEMTGGYGPYNVNQRLRLYFGDRGGVVLDYRQNVFTASIYHPVLRTDLGENR